VQFPYAPSFRAGRLLHDVLLSDFVDFIRIFNSPSANFAGIYGDMGITTLAIAAISGIWSRKRSWKNLQDLEAVDG